jgi:aspartate aminotransferase
VLKAMSAAIARKETGYTPNAGLPALRKACSAKLERVNGILRPPEQIVVSVGSMQGLFAVLLGLAEPGDEVLVPDPGWPNYAMACRLANTRAVPYRLSPEGGFQPDFDQVEDLVNDRTRLVVVNSPSNPLGVVWGADVMSAWLRVAERHDLWIVSDECYDEITFEQPAVSPAALEGGDERVVAVHSFSKTYAMTGLRVGYVSGPLHVMETLTKMQEALVACVNGPAQEGAFAALQGPQDFVHSMREVYARRRDRAVAVATDMGIPHFVPQGAFYLWLPLGSIGDTMEFARRLVADHHVAVAPGETFGRTGANAVRVSLANHEDAIEEGLRRLADAISR